MTWGELSGDRNWCHQWYLWNGICWCAVLEVDWWSFLNTVVVGETRDYCSMEAVWWWGPTARIAQGRCWGTIWSRLRRRREEGFWLQHEVVMAMNYHSWPWTCWGLLWLRWLLELGGSKDDSGGLRTVGGGKCVNNGGPLALTRK